jgi:cysteinyl-tRNA synthetase
MQLSGLLKSLGGVLGLLQIHPQDFLQAGNEVDEAQIQALIDARAQAKASKDFAEADRLRQTLSDMGVMLKDSAQGTQWERA